METLTLLSALLPALPHPIKTAQKEATVSFYYLALRGCATVDQINSLLVSFSVLVNSFISQTSLACQCHDTLDLSSLDIL